MTELVVPAPLGRRLLAAVYDGMLLLAVWFFAAVIDAGVRESLQLPYDVRLFRAYLFLVGLAFCGWFWTHGGQTLGMRAWRLQVRRNDGTAVNWLTACVRYAAAWLAWPPLALGVLWCAVDAERKALHDRLSGTEVVLLPKPVASG